MEVRGQLQTPAALPPEKEPAHYPMDRKLGEPQSQSGHCRIQKTLFLLPGIKIQLPIT
jgi:hypothetical protein